MPLIVHSPSTKYYAEIILKEKGGELLEVRSMPTQETLHIITDEKEIIAVGGGSVIDTAKIIGGDCPIYAIPTTAAGAACTPYATIWTENKKNSIPTATPILMSDYYGLSKHLPGMVRLSTFYDCLSHVVESWWSKKATDESKGYIKEAIEFLQDYEDYPNLNDLIDAGNLAGKAIAIAETNIIHALSYGLTIRYKVDHGLACSVFFKLIVDEMKPDIWLPKLPDSPIIHYDKDWVIDHALNYKKSQGYITKERLNDIL